MANGTKTGRGVSLSLEERKAKKHNAGLRLANGRVAMVKGLDRIIGNLGGYGLTVEESQDIIDTVAEVFKVNIDSL